MLSIVIKNKKKLDISSYEIGKINVEDRNGKNLICFCIYSIDKKEQLYVSESLVKVQYLFNKMVFCEQNNYICNIETEMEKFDDW